MATTKKTTTKKTSAKKATTEKAAKTLEARIGNAAPETANGNYDPNMRTRCPVIEYFYQTKDLMAYILDPLSCFTCVDLHGDDKRIDIKRLYNLDVDTYSCIFAGRNDMARITVVDQDIWLNTKDYVFEAEPDITFENLELRCYDKHDKSCTIVNLSISGTAWRRLDRTLTIAELGGVIKYIRPAETKTEV